MVKNKVGSPHEKFESKLSCTKPVDDYLTYKGKGCPFQLYLSRKVLTVF